MNRWKKLLVKFLEFFRCIKITEELDSDTGLTISSSTDSF